MIVPMFWFVLIALCVSLIVVNERLNKLAQGLVSYFIENYPGDRGKFSSGKFEKKSFNWYLWNPFLWGNVSLGMLSRYGSPFIAIKSFVKEHAELLKDENFQVQYGKFNRALIFSNLLDTIILIIILIAFYVLYPRR